MAVVSVDAELVYDFEGVLAPVFDVDKGVVERRAVIACEAVDLAEGARGGEDIERNDLVEEALELAVGELDAIEGFEVLAEVLLEGGPIADILAIGVLEITQLADEPALDISLSNHGRFGRRVFRVCHLR